MIYITANDMWCRTTDVNVETWVSSNARRRIYSLCTKNIELNANTTIGHEILTLKSNSIISTSVVNACPHHWIACNLDRAVTERSPQAYEKTRRRLVIALRISTSAQSHVIISPSSVACTVYRIPPLQQRSIFLCATMTGRATLENATNKTTEYIATRSLQWPMYLKWPRCTNKINQITGISTTWTSSCPRSGSMKWE